MMLSFAFLSILNPTDPLPLSGGTWEQGRPYEFAGLYLQGFRDSPHILGTSLGQELRELTLTNSYLIQYVDDLLKASPDFTSSQMDTIKTLNFLYGKGH